MRHGRRLAYQKVALDRADPSRRGSKPYEADPPKLQLKVAHLFCMFYTGQMRRTPTPPTLSLKFGRWFEAQATGWAVAFLPILVLALGVVLWLYTAP